jgi:2-polyprenyl-3-methyl-5-hydroxy-6-metoxy-1,4-benzoquinol methylase
MKTTDRLLQQWRIAKIRPYVKPGASVLDIGCADGALLRCVPNLGGYVGLDPARDASQALPHGALIKGYFPAD